MSWTTLDDGRETAPGEGSGRSAASFRDPDGFVFAREGVVYRQVNRSGRDDYDLLMVSGLYGRLAGEGLLVDHEEVDVAPAEPEAASIVIRPARVPFISYPYEWCFGQLKDAALLTLAIQRRAIEHGMTLKDASAFNVQFLGGRPVFIDTLSFARYREGEPWAAYRQFCQHFLAPLAVRAAIDPRLGMMARTSLDGLPLDLAARLLPWHWRLRSSLALHLVLHARLGASGAGPSAKVGATGFGRRAMLGLIDSLESAVGKLRREPSRTTWSDYYADNSYTTAAIEAKERIVAGFLERVSPSTVWDLGANTGRFSRLASARGASTVAFDADPGCVELSYRDVVRRGESNLLPLSLDLMNPSPGLGWDGRERDSLIDRGPADLAMALALVHHLAIANNVPLSRVAGFLARASRWLIIEFVPKGDPQVDRLLANRADIFPDYHQVGFERCFSEAFETVASEPLPEGPRRLYLMRRR